MQKSLCVAVGYICLLRGCAYFPDFELTLSAWLPVSEVVNEIRCDIYEFRKEHHPGEGTFSLDTSSYVTRFVLSRNVHQCQSMDLGPINS